MHYCPCWKLAPCLELLAKVGMPNIREYETSKLSKSEELIKKKRELHEHKSKLEAALAYENSRDLKGPLNAAISKADSVRGKIAKFDKQLAKLNAEVTTLKAALEVSFQLLRERMYAYVCNIYSIFRNRKKKENSENLMML